ncbi:MAG: rod-binding protein [Proteobacteria bacterium]|nr:rod-binding protein [Pseudomonadota bacterium]
METGLAGVYNDFAGLNRLRQLARDQPDQAVQEVAQQFEAIFVGMMMKAMRDATPGDGLFNSDQMEAYQDMFDKQLALNMSASGGLGLARIIERQIAKSSALRAERAP